MSAIEQAIAIRAEARSHRRMMRWHQNEARKQMDLLAQFCEANGIEIQVVTKKLQGESDDQS